MPAVLVNLINNTTLGDAQNGRIHKAVVLGVPFLARVLLQWRSDPNYNPDLIICFNSIAKVAKESPEKLANSNFAIDIHTGYVMMRD